MGNEQSSELVPGDSEDDCCGRKNGSEACVLPMLLRWRGTPGPGRQDLPDRDCNRDWPTGVTGDKLRWAAFWKEGAWTSSQVRNATTETETTAFGK